MTIEVIEVVHAREWEILRTWACASRIEARFCSSLSHPKFHQMPCCVWACLCRRGEGEHQRQHFWLFRRTVHCLLTHSSNWRQSSWQHIDVEPNQRRCRAPSGTEGLMSNESNRGEKNKTGDYYGAGSGLSQHKDDGMDTKWTWGWTGNDWRSGGREGYRMGYEGHGGGAAWDLEAPRRDYNSIYEKKKVNRWTYLFLNYETSVEGLTWAQPGISSVHKDVMSA